MSECNGSCSSCGSDCAERKAPQSFIEKLGEGSSVKKVIGIVSGKGGVGKSLVTGLLAAEFAKKGSRTAVLDADITGPSIPKIFGINERCMGSEKGLIPITSQKGVKIMSINLLLENPSDPVIWRGPVIAGVVKQFWNEVIWEDVDYMFVDMPPGTGDVPLTVFQSIPLDGIVIVASPQDLVSMIVGKAAGMAKMMNIPILGIVENMSYIECPDCGKKIYMYGQSHVSETAEQYGLSVLGSLPVDPDIAAKCDSGKVEDIEDKWLSEAIKAIEAVEAKPKE
ncbi:MAG: Mrp/NBP35 family ATP-binding protein [Oscillospiraceae bacterium]|nr:Mrp/NBP35 family ATP-binding protein [Oscillospiraceae bacterium]